VDGLAINEHSFGAQVDSQSIALDDRRLGFLRVAAQGSAETSQERTTRAGR